MFSLPLRNVSTKILVEACSVDRRRPLGFVSVFLTVDVVAADVGAAKDLAAAVVSVVVEVAELFLAR
jgi:hypothetical protein